MKVTDSVYAGGNHVIAELECGHYVDRRGGTLYKPTALKCAICEGGDAKRSREDQIRRRTLFVMRKTTPAWGSQ